MSPSTWSTTEEWDVNVLLAYKIIFSNFKTPNKMKNKFILHYRKEPNIKVGDVVKLTDTVSMTVLGHEYGPLYLSNSYPDLLGTDALLKNMWGKVVETNCVGYGCEGIFDTDIYVQDAVVEFSSAFGKKTQFRICSDHLRIPDVKEHQENLKKEEAPDITVLVVTDGAPENLGQLIHELLQDLL